MDYQIAVREDKGLEVGTPPPLIQGEKGVDRLVFTLPDPYRGMALDDFSFTANLESAAGCHKLAAARSERVAGAVRCVLELDCSLEGLRDEVLLSLEGRDGQRVLATRKTALRFVPGARTEAIAQAGEGLFESFLQSVSAAQRRAETAAEAASLSALEAENAKQAVANVGSLANQSAARAAESENQARQYQQLCADDRQEVVAAAQAAQTAKTQTATDAQNCAEAAEQSQLCANSAQADAAAAQSAATAACTAASAAESAAGALVQGRVLPGNLLQNPSFEEGEEGWTLTERSEQPSPLHGRYGAAVGIGHTLETAADLDWQPGDYLVAAVARGVGRLFAAAGDCQVEMGRINAKFTLYAGLLHLEAAAAAPLTFTVVSGRGYLDCALLFAVPADCAGLDAAQWLQKLQHYPYTWGAGPQGPVLEGARRATALGADVEGLARFSAGVPLPARPGVDYAPAAGGDCAFAGEGCRVTGQSCIWRRQGDFVALAGEVELDDCQPGFRLVGLPLPPRSAPVGGVWRCDPPCGEELALAGEVGADGLAFAVRRGGSNQPAPALEGAAKCWIWVWYLV
ncbi:hypothetical protein KQI11_06460 [Acetanaerobacterium sp. MSJ-12]|nr:hypothetical protein [Acetanaerobacterium sp. MSJ-12]MBU5419763.1 hypothetical protein [Acetanaerobacterium sp. MSJ-12]